MTHPHTYLATLVDGGGTVPPEIGTVRRLVDRGHRVIVLAEDTMADEARAAGAEFLPWAAAPNRPSHRPEDDPWRDWEAKGPKQLFDLLLDRAFVGPAAGYAADTTRAIAEHKPDTLVSSVFALGSLIAAEAADLPHAVLMPNIYPLPTPGMPPFGAGLRPARTPVGTTLHTALSRLVERMFDKGGAPGLNAVRASYSLPPLTHFWDQVRRVDRQLLLTSPAFEFAGQLPENVRYVGPVLDDPTWTEPWVAPEGDEPLVLVAMSSTYQEQDQTLQRVVDALGALPVRGLVTTGPALDPAVITAPANVTVVTSAPHNHVLQHAAVLITHGGHGTVMKALAADVPLVVMPHGRDQKDNGVRVALHGAGVMVRKTASSATLAKAVRRLVQDPGYREGAARLGEAIRRDAAGDALVRELEALPHRAGQPVARLRPAGTSRAPRARRA